ncbi:MAG: dTDP-4-dehydrorhamnose reductase [Phycisphaerales bacterium]|nr:dTDP-4-dehydrorhamnose reductase [Phycisphaerales bacterium]
MSNVFDRILVTGGKGMLACAFKQRFAGGQLNVKFADRTICDVCDEDSVKRAFHDIQPTLILNCSAYTKVDLAEKEQAAADQCNGYGVGHLASLCRDYNAMLVHFSTDYVFDGTLSRPLQPGDPLGPLGAYGKSKLLGEKLLQENAPARWLILRTAWLYGPGGPCFPATMVNVAKQGKPLKVIDDQHGTPTFTYDLVEATLNLIHLGANGIWHLTNSGETTWYDFTAAILEEFDLKTDLSRTTSADWKKLKPDSAHRPAYSVLDVTPYEQFTHLPMPGWRDALHRYRTALEQPAAL